jgi:hypothetical protein
MGEWTGGSMAKPEASLWDYLRTVLPVKGHYSRIESDTCPGFPDVHYSIHGYSGTIELKATTKAPFRKKGLRKSQIDWIAEEDISGGAVWIIAQVHDSVLSRDRIFLIDGNTYFEEFNEMDLGRLASIAEMHWIRGEDSPTDDLESFLAARR